MPRTRIKRIEEETGEVRYFGSLKEAANVLGGGTKDRSIRNAIKKNKTYCGYRWEKVENGRVFEPWMVDYIEKHYDGPESIAKIAKQIGREEKQIRNKIDYLGIKKNKKEQIEEDPKMIDFDQYRKRVVGLKSRIKKGSIVKVAFYAEDILENCNKTTRVLEVEVDGAYPSFINVVINGIRRSYSYDEVLEVVS